MSARQPAAPRSRTTAGDPPDSSRRLAALPWWRRPRRLSRQLAGALVLTALLALATFGGLNYVAARDLLVVGTQNQLAAIGATRASTIEAGAERLAAAVSAASADLGVARGLELLVPAFAELEGTPLTAEQEAELAAQYEERIVEPLTGTSLGPVEVDDLLPMTAAGRYLQYHYTARPPGTPAPVDPGDGSRYSQLNAQVNADVELFSESLGGGDVLLIDDEGTIVYSLFKRNDLGTNLVSGPYAGGALAEAVTERLPLTRVGTAVLTDFSVSASGRAALYAVTAVSNGKQVVGALAVEVPVERLNAIVSNDGKWDEVGLGDGDGYLVAPDLVLQSEPRSWTEDPQGYLERLRSGDEDDQAEAELIEVLGSPVGVQLIETEPVRAAAAGEEFVGSARDIAGDPVFAAASSFTAGGQQWVVVTEAPRSAVLAPLGRYIMQILLVLAILLPVVAVLAVWLSRLLTRPIRPTVEAAQAVVEGDRDPCLNTGRPDEFGDLGRRLVSMADSLAEHEAELAREYERTRQLLLAVLPPALVDEDGQITGTGDAAERATVVAVALLPSGGQQDQEQLSESLRSAAALAEEIAARTSLNRVRIAADRYLFVAGMDRDDAGADDALEFAVEFRRSIVSEIDLSFDLHVGLSSGSVATGVLDTGSLTFGAWGDPVRRALALASLSAVDTVLIDATTAESCSRGRWQLEPAHDVVGLDGEPMELFTLQTDEAEAAATL